MSDRLSVTEWGMPEGDPVVLLHGFLGCADDWRDVAAVLGRRRRVLAVDLPGHGSSVGLPSGFYSLDGAVGGVLDAVRPFGPFALVGYSMGGRLAYHVAAADPDRVSVLVAESAHPGLATQEEREERRALDRRRADALRQNPRAFLEAWYEAPMFGAVARNPGLRARLVERRLAGDPAELCLALEGMGTGNQAPIGERLRATRVPTLLVAGSADGRYATLLGSMAARMGAWLHAVPGAGHTVHLEAPDTFAAATQSFIAHWTQRKQSWPL